MPNRANEPHAKDLRKLASGRRLARVTHDDPDPDKRREASTTFATEPETKTWSRKQGRRLREDPDRTPPTPTVEGLLTGGQETRPTALRPTPWEMYRGKLEHVIEELGNWRPRSLTTLDIQPRYARSGSRLGAQLVVHVHRVLRHALPAAEDGGLIPKHPSPKVALPRVPRPDLRIHTGEEAERFMAAAQPHRLQAPWVGLASNHTRVGEALGARWDDGDDGWCESSQPGPVRANNGHWGRSATHHIEPPSSKTDCWPARAGRNRGWFWSPDAGRGSLPTMVIVTSKNCWARRGCPKKQAPFHGNQLADNGIPG